MRSGSEWNALAAHWRRWGLVPLLSLLIFSCAQEQTVDRAQALRDITHRMDAGDYPAAGKAARQNWSADPNSEWGWRFKLQYVSALLYQQKVDEAGGLLSAALPARYSKLEPQYLYLNAYLRYYRHDPSAPALLASAIASARRQSDPLTEANSLLLRLAEGEENKPDADEIAQQALSLSQRSHLPFQEAASRLALGMILLTRENYSGAIPYFSENVPLAEKIGAHYLEVASIANLGEAYFSLGDLDRALRSLLDAHARLRDDDPGYMRINVNNELGSLQSLRQQNSEALKYFQEAFKIAAPDQRLSGYVPAADNLAQSLIEAADLNTAEKYNRLAADALQRFPAAGSGLAAQNILIRSAIAAARGHLDAAYAGYHEVLEMLRAQPPSSTLWSAYAQLAEVEERLGKTSDAGRDFARALDAIETNRSAQKGTDYQITFLSALIRFYQQYIDFLIRQNQPWTALAVADSSRASVLTQGQIASREEPGFKSRLRQQAKASGCALLFYWLAPRASYVWAITPAGDAFQQLPLSKAEIERDVESYSHYIQVSHADTRGTANVVGLRLYQTLIGPVAGLLATAAKVVVVPDGALHSLNFETLLIPGASPRYWLEDATVTVAPSLGILLTPAKARSPSGRALIIGDPVYDGAEYPALPQSGQEVTLVSERFSSGSVVLTKTRAVRTAYASSKPGSFSFIHFSAHVDADARSPLDSAIILSPSGGGNRLYARDFMAIPLSAGLVTISGCRSVGAKALSGEGMVGFAWAAFQAGAQNAVTSLWAVDDRSTVDLMDKFYAGLQSGQPYATALREAKLQMLHTRYQRPYYWAPFQLYSRALAARSRMVMAKHAALAPTGRMAKR